MTTRPLAISTVLCLALLSCTPSGSTRAEGDPARRTAPAGPAPTQTASEAPVGRAIFAGGCFWCMQPPFDKLPGVLSTRVGYTGGAVKKPTYGQVCTGSTGHAEAIEVRYDPKRVSYEALLQVYWRSIDPTDAGGQFADRGDQYRPVIFYTTEAQRRTAQRSKAALERSGRFRRPIAVSIRPAVPFYPAERYHQGFYRKHPERYRGYKVGSGRAGYLERHWGKGK